MATSAPYLSVVATAPGDAQAFVDAWIHQAQKHNLSSELILIQPPSPEALRLPSEVRVIRSDAPEAAARNAGIRAARGEFILATNAGIRFSEELVRFLAARMLERGRLYRIDRYDTAGEQPVRIWSRHGVFNLTPEGLRQNAPDDIAPPGSGIYLGPGWYGVESGDTGRFRWMENDAELQLRVPPGGGILRLEVEPGPAAGSPPYVLHVLDGNGDKVAEWSAGGRALLRIHIPPSAEGLQRITLHVPNGGLPVPHDPRIMNFRCFRCEWFDPPAVAAAPAFSRVFRAEQQTLTRLLGRERRAGVAALFTKGPDLLKKAVRLLGMRGGDIFDAAVEFEPRAGWHKLERNGDTAFRWSESYSELVFCFDDGTSNLAMIVEPGPGIFFQPFDLVVRHADGKVAGKARIDGITYVEFPLPIRQGVQNSVFLSAEGVADGGTVAGDDRALDFRIFACGRGTVREPLAQTVPAKSPWAAHTVFTNPPGIDWPWELRLRQKEIAEMGKPDSLHLFACGDFQLMAREHWLDVRGYAELDGCSTHVDALLSFAAQQRGVREEVLTDPLRVYHTGPGSPAGGQITATDLADMVAHMRILHAPLLFNLGCWGMDRWGMQAQPEPAAGEPYISVVVAARNDNHGGNMLGRMQAFLDSWLEQAKRYDLPSEIVVVEWNPPPGRPSLKDELRWPASTGPCQVRFIEAPPAVHAALPNSAAIPLHQMIAKNAGIRRARGRFVLATNIDIVFSAELMQFLAGRQLDPQALYRMDRYDVASEIPAGGGVDELLEFCKAHILRVSASGGSYGTNGDNIRPVEAEDIIAADAGLRLGRGWFSVEKIFHSQVMRYFEPSAEVVFERPASGERQILLDVEVGPSAQDGWVDLEVVDSTGATVGFATLDARHEVRLTIPEEMASGRFGLRTLHGGVAIQQDTRMLDLRVFGIKWGGRSLEQGWKVEVISRQPWKDWTEGRVAQSPYAGRMRNPRYLHTNACGDFTLLSREAWHAIRGYPEFPIWPTHLDALVCYAAYHAGVREVVLGDPMRIFHIDHPAVWTPDGEAARSARAAAIGVPLVSYLTLLQYLHYMRRFNAPLIFCGENWGLGDASLGELHIGHAPVLMVEDHG